MHLLHHSYHWQVASRTHYSAIQALVAEVLNEYGLKQGAVDYCLEDIDLHYFQKGGFFGVVLDARQRVIATAGLMPSSEAAAEIRKMYLCKEHRGKGIGKFMLHQLIEIAQQKGIKRLELETASVLKEAIGLYQQFGFRPFVAAHLSKRCDQAYELLLSV